ncbi:MAG: hypothetical protein IKL51_09550 [Lachnospiraceae bacterium]|nr:hypothetical protein [Lachnospiraceae bacterium]
MKFHHHLYLGSGIKNKEKIIRKLKYGAGMRNIYVISLSRGRDQLDCTHCCYLKQRKLRNHLGLVVGLANGQEEMTEVVIQMLKDCYETTGTANIKEFLLERVVSKV